MLQHTIPRPLNETRHLYETIQGSTAAYTDDCCYLKLYIKSFSFIVALHMYVRTMCPGFYLDKYSTSIGTIGLIIECCEKKNFMAYRLAGVQN